MYKPAAIFRLIIFSLLISLTLFHNDFAQGNGVITGFVTDSTSGEPLAFCNVYIQELQTGASTNSRGYYIITAVPPKKSLKIYYSYVGYKTKVINIVLNPGESRRLNIQLIPSSFQLSEVEKIGEREVRKNETDLSLDRISMKEVQAMPKGVETDILRSIHFLPGVQSFGGVSAKYYVRGGAGDQNLVLFNDVPVYSPFHAMGLFGVVDPDIISNVEFYKGAFQARYGGRISSVLKLITKEGNRFKYSGKAALSMLSAKVLAEGPISHGSFIITGRKSISNFILKKFLNDRSVPINFYDAAFKVNYSDDNFWKDVHLSAFGFFSGDFINGNNRGSADYNWKNYILGFNYFLVSNSPFVVKFSINTSEFNGEVISNESNIKPQKNHVKDSNFKLFFNYFFENKDEIYIGLDFNDITTDLFLANAFGAVSNVGRRGTNVNIYADYKLLRFDNLGVDFGTRVNLIQLTAQDFSAEPRLNFKYWFNPLFAFKGAWGIYQQEMATLSDERDVISVFDPWLIIPYSLKPERALTYISGFEYHPFLSTSFELEAYYKVTHNLPILNDKKYFPEDPDFIEGRGEAYGIEFKTGLKFAGLGFTGSYAYSKAFKEVNGLKYPPRYDSPHNISLLLEYNFGNGWASSAMWKFNSGRPFTQIAGYYDKFMPGNSPGINSIFQSYMPYIIFSGTNLARLPDYHRLDISLSKIFKIGSVTFHADVSVLNVYNRKNFFYFDRSTGKVVNMLPVLPTATIKAEL
jgi:hypothetical protein